MNLNPATKVRLVIVLLGVGMAASGLATCVSATYDDIKYTRFTISRDAVAEYGYFANISKKTEITGLIMEPRSGRGADSGLRPCVLYFHGMFARKEYHIHHSMYLARAGFVVIMVDHAGEGGSMGTYRLGLECEAIGLTVVDWLFDYANSTYNLRVNGSQVGATGHSYGGATTLLLGINRPDVLKACVSVWTWSNLTRTMGIILGQEPGDMFGSQLWDLLSMSSFPSAVGTNKSGQTTDDPADYYNNLAERDTLPRVNFTGPRPPNWLLVTAEDDSLTDVDEQVDVVANASFDPWNGAGWDYATFRSYVEANVTEGDYWDNLDPEVPDGFRGDFASKTARGLYLPKNNQPLPHLVEGLRVDDIVLGLEWFGRAFAWDVSGVVAQLEGSALSVPGESYRLPATAMARYAGFGVMVLGLILLGFQGLAFLLRGGKSEEEFLRFQTTPIMPEQETSALAVKIMTVCAVFFISTLFAPVVAFKLGFSGPTIGVPYLLFDAFTAILLARALFLVPFMVVFYLAMRAHSQLQWAEVGVEKNNLAIGLIAGSVVALGFISAYNVLAYFTVFPLIFPVESPEYGFMGTYLLFGYFALFGFLDEILLRGIVQGGIERAVERAPKISKPAARKWVAYAASVAISGTVNLVAGVLGIFIIAGTVPTGLILQFVFVPVYLYAVVTSIVNTYLYQCTKSVIPGVASTMIFFALFFSANVFGGIGF
ncbi:MAG: alpha/beta hydrolase family protein [Promethearchaeota archaeon]